MGNFVNPIIEAMFRSSQMKQQARQQTEIERSNLEDEKLRKEQLDANNKLQQKQFDLQATIAELQRKKADYDATVQQLQIGAQPKRTRATSPTGNPRLGEEKIVGPLGGTLFDPADFATPQQRLKTEMDFIAGVTRAQLGAQEEFKIAGENRAEQRDINQFNRERGLQLEILGKRDEYDNNRLKIQQQFEANQRQLDRQSREKISLRQDATDRMRIRQNAELALITGSEQFADTIDGYIDGLTITGGINLSQVPTGKNVRNAVKGEMQRRGLKEITKQDQAVIDNIGESLGLIKLLEDWADADTGITTGIQSLTGMGDSPSAGFSNDYDIRLQRVTKDFGSGETRLSDQDVARFKSAHRVTASPEKNKETAQNLKKDILEPKIKAVLSKFSPEQQEQLLLSRGLDPTGLIQDNNSDEVEEYERDPQTGRLKKVQRGR